MNARIADLIREGRADEITDAVAEGEFFQMQTFTQALIEHVLSGEVDSEVAANAATNRHDFLVSLEQAIKRKRAADDDAANAPTPQRSTFPSRKPMPAPTIQPVEPDEGLGLRIVPAGLARMRRLAPLALCSRVAAARAAPRARTPSRSSPPAPLALPGLDAEPVARRAVRRCPRRRPCPCSSRIRSCSRSGSGPARRTGSRGRCSPRSTRSSRTGAATWARARPARSAGCSSCPSTWLRWGVDANGDGVADPWNPTDAIFSAARYLAAAGGATDLYRGVFAYNHADWYVNEVLALANLYGGEQRRSRSRSTGCSRTSTRRAQAVVDASDEL